MAFTEFLLERNHVLPDQDDFQMTKRRKGWWHWFTVLTKALRYLRNTKIKIQLILSLVFSLVK